MNVKELFEKLSLELKAGEISEREISGCYIGDLLSLAMARVESGNIWITIQTNINIVAVASLTDAACIILAEGLSPDDNAAKKADAEDIAVLSSPLSAYELAARLAELGI